MSAVIEINEAGFERDVLQSPESVLVDFWAPWCGWCKKLAPVLEDVAQEFAGKAKVVSLNVDENPEIKARYNVGGIPHLMLFKDGLVADQIVGYAAKEIVASMLSPSEAGEASAELTQADFEKRVERSAKPALVVFGSPIRGAYRALIRNAGSASRDFADWGDFFKINTDNAPDLLNRFHISVPSVLLFKDGKVVDRMDGDIPEETIVSMLSSTEGIAPPDEVAGAEFERRVLLSETSVLVECWGPWMGSYSRTARIVREHFPGRVQFFRLNIEEYPDVRERYKAPLSGPTLSLFTRGQIVAQISGYVGSAFVPEDEIIRTLTICENDSRNEISVPSLTPSNLEQQVSRSREPLLVYLGATWMASYQRVAHLLEENFGGGLKLCRVDTDAYPEIVERYNARMLPVILLFKDGQVVQKFPGYVSSQAFADHIIADLAKHFTAIDRIGPAHVPDKPRGPSGVSHRQWCGHLQAGVNNPIIQESK